jgi:hypothetical protein
LGLFVPTTSELTDEAVLHAYYSLLLDRNMSHAEVVAQQAFADRPADPARRMVYAFSLWKQQRASEAISLVSALNAAASSDLVPVPLLRAVIQAQLRAADDARANLSLFNLNTALPEEKTLAAKVTAQLKLQVQASTEPTRS